MLKLVGRKVFGVEIMGQEENLDPKRMKQELKTYEELKRTSKLLAPFKDNPAFSKNVSGVHAMLKSFRAGFKENQFSNEIAYKYKVSGGIFQELKSQQGTKFEAQALRKLNADSLYIQDVLSINPGDSTIQTLKRLKETKQKKVSNARSKARQMRLHSKAYSVNLPTGPWSYNLVAGTHQTENEILTIKKMKTSPSVFTAKAPTTNENHVGIELEFTSRHNNHNLGFALNKAGLGQYCNLKTDGSVRDEDNSGYHPHELAICVPESKCYDVIDLVCKTLNDIGAKVNKSCGLHTHVDMRNRDRDLVFSNLVASQWILYNMQPKERRMNKFCKKVNTRSFEEELNDPGETGDRTDRYKGVNARAYNKYRTIEMRMHSGTTNASKIKNWVKLLLKISDRKTPVEIEPKAVNTFVERFHIDEKLSAYINERVNKFKSEKEGIEKEYSGEVA